MIAGKYVLDRLLGQGGMGAVFAAKHIKLSKPVAIKIMLADASNPEAAQRFINEGRAAANIQNEHVVRVDDVDEELGYAYMVLELLDGEDLAQVLEREPTHRLAPHVAVGYVLQALKGVTQAHAIGIVHRDLKPSNLFLAKRKDGSFVVKVLDFGISKAQGSSALAASPSALTSTKAMLGSPLYMSPEQLRSSKSVDHRADIWAMGIILYELITGHLPFMGDSLGELFAAILETDPAPLRTRVPEVPPGLDDIVLRCLQRRPEHRIQTVTELAEALAPYASASASASAQPMLAGTAMLPSGGVMPAGFSSGSLPQQGAVTPGGSGMPRPPLPSTGASTGSGPRIVGGTVALGTATPQGMQQTASGWQSTGTGAGVAGLPKSKTPLVIGLVVAGALLLLGVVGVLLVVKSMSKEHPSGDPTVAASSLPPPSATPSETITPPPSAPPEVAAEPSAIASANASASASATAARPNATTTTTAKGGVKQSGKASDPGPSVPPPSPPSPAPKPTSPKPHEGNLQNTP